MIELLWNVFWTYVYANLLVSLLWWASVHVHFIRKKKHKQLRRILYYTTEKQNIQYILRGLKDIIFLAFVYSFLAIPILIILSAGLFAEHLEKEKIK